MSHVLLHTPDEHALSTVMRRSRAGDDVEIPRRDATAELDGLVSRGMARYVDSPDPLTYDVVIRGGERPHERERGRDDTRHRTGDGRVVLVGGGPGDPGLLTIAGLDAVRAADVIVCDRLAPLDVLDQAHPNAEIVHVGKIPRGDFTPQERINELLIQHARAGRRVVRFKGGDTFLFGRGGEEWEACVTARVPVEVVPGVSSALAVPALAGIPVTHRSLTQGVTIVSGHVPPGDARSTVDWTAVARSRTSIVVLMGVATLPAIAAALVEAGMPPLTPAAVVENGATPTQRVVRGTLETVAVLAESSGVRAPAITVIGDVVEALRPSAAAADDLGGNPR